MAFRTVCYKVVRPQHLCFTQDSISVTFKRPRDQERIDDAVDLIMQGKLSPKAFPKMNVVEVQGRLWSLDNRRLWVFKKAEVNFITVTLVVYDFGKGFHSLSSTSPYLYYTMSKTDFFPRVRGHCKEIFNEEYPELSSSPPLSPTLHSQVPQSSELPIKIHKNSIPSDTPSSDSDPDTPPKTPKSARPSKVSTESKQWDSDDDDHGSHHRDVPSHFEVRNSDTPFISMKRRSAHYGPSSSQSKRLRSETERNSRTHHEACPPPPAEVSRAASYQLREWRTLSSKPKPPDPMTPLQRRKAPRPPATEVRVLSPRRKVNAPQAGMSSQTVTRLTRRNVDDRPTEPKVLSSDKQPSLEKQPDKRPALPPRSEDTKAQGGREASSTSRAVKRPRRAAAPRRNKKTRPTSTPPNFSYGFHTLRKRSKASRGSKKTVPSATATWSSSTQLNDPLLPSSDSPKTRRASSEATSKIPLASLPSLSTTASPATTTKKRGRDGNFTSDDMLIPSVTAPTSPTFTSKKLPDDELHTSSPCPDPSEDDYHHSIFGSSLTTTPRQESAGLEDWKIMIETERNLFELEDCEIMTESEWNLFKLNKPAAVVSELPVLLTPREGLSQEDRQMVYDIVELVLKDAWSPLRPARTTPTVDAQEELTVTGTSTRQLPSQTPIDEVRVKPQEDEPQEMFVQVDVPVSVVDCPVQNGSKGQVEPIPEVLVPVGSSSAAFHVNRATGNVGVTVTTAMETPELKESTPVRQRKVQEIQSKTEGNAADHQQGTKALSRGPGYLETARTENNDNSARLPKSRVISALSKSVNEGQEVSQCITRGQIRRQKEMARRKARARRIEMERKFVVKRQREVKSLLKEKLWNAPNERKVTLRKEREAKSSLKEKPLRAPNKREVTPRRRELKSLLKEISERASNRRKVVANREREAIASLKEKLRSAPNHKTTDIVPFDPEKSEGESSGVRALQGGDMVYVKVNAELTSSAEGQKQGPKSKARLHPYLRIIGPFRVKHRFNRDALVLEFPDDCGLKRIVRVNDLLKSRSPLDINYLPESRISVRLKPEIILNRRVVRRLKKRKVLHYLVKWSNLPATEATWEPETIFDEHPHLLDQMNSPLLSNPYLLRNWRS